MICRSKALTVVLLIAGALSSASPPATAASLSEAELEQCLRKGKIVDNRLIGSGVTRPYRLELDCNGIRVAAAFKILDQELKGLTRFENASPELHFTDSYRYERAAYLIDRYLGLEMVPVTVTRFIGRNQGAAIAWVEEAISPEELRQTALTDAERSRMSYQEGLMTLFDSLIKNVDRNQGNMLITKEDLRLHLIDHSRAFRQEKELSTKLVNERIALPEDVYERLRRLSLMDGKELREVADKSISRALSKAVIARAVLIVEKIDQERTAYGDETVFQPLPPFKARDR
jgi:hypothetical protein